MLRIRRDIAHAVRALASRPVLTATTVATLAIGIGGTSAMFSVANGLLLRPLPVPAPDRMVRVFGTDDVNTLGITSYANLHDVAERARTFDAFTIHQQTFVSYGLGEDTAQAAAELVDGAYFRTFRVPPALGRALTDEDDRSAARVAVVSDRWWRSRLGGAPDAVGQTVHLNGAAFTVVGIAPPTFRGSYDTLLTDVWVPLMTYDVVRPRGLDIRRRSWGWLQASARLADGATVASAQAEATTLSAALRADYPRENAALQLTVVAASTVPESMTPELSRALTFALLVAALALLAACANVASASLATVTDRASEIAVRMALGATRADVARQWLTESLVATGAATGLGAILAVWVRDGLLALRPLSGLENFAPALEIGWPVWLCTAGLMAAATCLSGVLPALRASRVDPAGPLRDGALANVGGSRRQWMRTLLVSAQAAVALALVALAGLLGRSVGIAQGFDVGFDRRDLVLATANVSALGHDDAASYRFHADTMARVRALPGAVEVTAASVVPLGDNDERRGVVIDGYTPPDGSPVLSLANNVVWPGYFEFMRMPLVAGRTFAEADGRPGAPFVAVVNETMARTYWPAGQAVGRLLRLDSAPVEVVGVVKDITYYSLGEAPLPYLYLAYGPAQPYRDGLTFHVRSHVDPAVMARQLAGALRASDPRVRVVGAMSYDDLRAAALFPAKAIAWLSTAFGTLALALFLVGTYGVTAYAVAARRRELAVRVALGAAPDAVRADVVKAALAWGAPGALAGVLLAGALSQLLRSFLTGVDSLDPASMLGGVATVLLTGALAAYVAVRRVGRIDISAVLRG